MGLITLDARTAVRHRWRAFAGVALLLGLTGGLSLFAIAGARRTQSAYPRFLRSVDASTLSVSDAGGFDPKQTAEIAAFPEVVRSRTYVSFQTWAFVGGKPDFSQDFEPDGTFDGRYFDQDRFTPTQGRMSDPHRVDEVVVNEFAAKRLGYRVGQQLELGTYAFAPTESPTFFGRPPPPNLLTRVTIVGIGVFPDEVIQDDADRTPRLLLTPAFSQEARAYVTYGLQGLVLAHGDADISAVKARINQLAPPGLIEFRVTSVDAFHELQATRPLSVALGLFGVIVGLAGLVLVMQALSRVLQLDRDRNAVLRALGATPRELAAGSVLAAGVAILVGSVLAVLLALAASPLMPIGPIRRVEVTPGIDLDLTVLAVGFVVMVVVLASWSALVARRELPHRLALRSGTPPAPSRLLARLSSSGLRPTATVGLRFALERDGRSGAVGTRSVMVGAAIALAALVASVTFGSSLHTLVAEPRLYGWNWDAALDAGDGYGNIDPHRTAAILDRDPAVASWSGAYFGSDSIDGLDVPLIGMDGTSAVTPPILHGRMIEHEDEVVLGPTTATNLDKSIGDEVRLVSDNRSTTLRVVGIATFPTIGEQHVAHTSLGVGALVAHHEIPGYDRDITGALTGDLGPHVVFVRYEPGTDAAAELAHLRKTTAPLAGFAGLDVLAVQRPAEIVNSRSVTSSPELLAAAVALGAALSLGLAIAASVRRRRRDLAVLKTLGFTRRQLTATVAWLASMTIAVGLIVGVPVGILIGRDLWIVFADQLDVVARPTVPVGVLVLIVVGALIVANVVAAIPAYFVRRVDPSQLLRSP